MEVSVFGKKKEDSKFWKDEVVDFVFLNLEMGEVELGFLI